jgi:enamine deaminase RidA (YjgF/YER057c/UK114 family)
MKILHITFFILLLSVTTMAQVNKKFINPFGSKPPGYTHVVATEAGTTLYISGQVPVNQAGQLVGEKDLKAQTIQVYENLLFCLKSAGATFEDVVKMNTYVVNYKPSDIEIIREVRKGYLSKENPPASTLVGVQALVSPDFLIEIEAIAVIPTKK